ncbi:MAG: hypothetical protein AB7H43_13430 [Acidimicrobiia bacterium]
MTGTTWADVVLLAAALLTAFGVIWRKALRPAIELIQAATREIEVFKAVPERLDKLDERSQENGVAIADVVRRVSVIERRTETLEPNGGTSTYDRVKRTDERLSKENP